MRAKEITKQGRGLRKRQKRKLRIRTNHLTVIEDQKVKVWTPVKTGISAGGAQSFVDAIKIKAVNLLKGEKLLSRPKYTDIVTFGSLGGKKRGGEEPQSPRQFILARDREAVLAHRFLEEITAADPKVKTLCETYGLRREELGRLTGFSLRAMAEWSAGKRPSQPARRRLHEVRRLLDALAEVVFKERIAEWLRTPNPAFEQQTPLQVIEQGEIDRLWAMVHDLGSGSVS